MKLSTRVAVLIATAVLSACGGGGGEADAVASQPGTNAGFNDGTTAQTPAPLAANATEIPSEAVTVSDYGTPDEVSMHAQSATDTSGTVLTVAPSSKLISSDFEQAFTTVAAGWSINWWGSPAASYTASRETRAGYTSSGSGAQRFRVNALGNGGGAHLIYSYGFVKDTDYQTALSLRSDVATQVEVQIRRNGSPYNVVARKVVSVGPAWQRVELQGTYGFADAGALRIIPLATGTDIYVDDVTIRTAAATIDLSTGIATPVSGGIDLPAEGGRAVETSLSKKIDADEPFVRFADGFYFNAFGGTSQGEFVATRETRAGYVHAGASSQRFQVIDKKGGDVHLIASYPFVNGKTYRATAWLRADVDTPLQFFMRMDAHPWQPFGSANVTVGTSWTKVQIEGAFVADVPGSVRVALKNATGTVWVDDLTIEEVKKNDMAPVSTEVIPDTLFGIHVNRLGVHQRWPGLGTKIVRLWNTGTNWRELQPTPGAWDFRRLDMYVDYILKNEPQAEILYTMGQTPTWASSTPTFVNHYGPGAGGPPTDMNDWRIYVRTLAQRYAGRIRHWELWNEADYSGTYNGTVPQLVELARVAHEELKAVDPANTLVSPGFTASQGVTALDNFLAAGGGAYTDIVGFHWYYSTNPESIAASIDNVRNLMKSYGIASKPLWNTEGAFVCNPAVSDCATSVPSASESRGVNARALFLMAAKGISNFNYYTWEATSAYSKLVESDYLTPTVAASAFAEARGWAQGAKVVDAYRVDDKVYVLRMARGSDNFVVIWATQTNTLVNLPTAWNVSRMRNLSGNESAIPSTRQLTLGIEPVQLRR